MKTKILISAVIFIVMYIFLYGIHQIGIDRIPLSEYPTGLGKVWITFYLVICLAAICAALPFAPEIIKKVFRRSWEQ